MKKILFIGLLVIIAVISGCTYGTKTETGSQPTATPPVSTATAAGTAVETIGNETIAPATVSVQIKGFAYNPAVITVAKGTTVTWTQLDSAAQHTVTGSGFDSGNLNAGDTFNRTFNKTGNFSYSCSKHPGMTGTVVVT